MNDDVNKMEEKFIFNKSRTFSIIKNEKIRNIEIFKDI